MSHYFLNDNNLKDNEYSFEYTFKGKVLKFISNNGIFSKRRVDFGTNLLINALDDLSNKEILDIGTGVGVIGICLASYYKTSFITMSDVNKSAIEYANKNLTYNNITNAKVLCSDLYDSLDKDFDCIVSNPPIRAGKSIVHGIAKGSYERLHTNGVIYMVIQKKQGADSMKKVLLEAYGNCEVKDKKNGYVIYKSVKKA